MQRKINWHDNLLTNGENLLQGKNSTRWISAHHSQESTNQESRGYKYKKSYHYPGLSQNTNLQLNLYFNPQLDLIL